MKVGKRNLITDVPGLRVGNAQDQHIKTGTTVLTADRPLLAGVHIMGGAPGTREVAALAPDRLVERVDALVLSGGSAFGLDAASGVADTLREQGRGFAVGPVTIPIVPAAILFDLLNGSDSDWSQNPYPALGRQALTAASDTFDLGSCGAGTGATCATLKGGLGSASVVLDNGLVIGALIAANPHGSPIVDDGPHFHAAMLEVDGEFGGLGPALQNDPLRTPRNEKLAAFQAKANTTIGIVATNATLTKAQATRLAVAAHDGMARALMPSHTLYDGDLLFAVSTEEQALADPLADAMQLGHVASLCVSRAIARAAFLATAAPGDTLPTWQQRFGASPA